MGRERGEERVSEMGKEVTGRSRPSHWSGSTSWLGADRWAWPTSGPGMAEREREVEGVFLTRNLKTEIEKKKRTFLEKSFSM
jgi:hypothetical protein